MEFVVEQQPPTFVPVKLDAQAEVSEQAPRFPVHRIYCVGRNYSEHVKEMGGDPKQEPPVFFSKPASACVTFNQDVAYPQATNDLHHEVELVVALKSGGKNIDIESAMDCVYGYAVGIDFTRRDLQAIAKSKGRPWDLAKGFDQSAPISAILPASEVAQLSGRQISLKVNDEIRQQASLSEMIWSVPEIISELSKFFELKSGDIIYTGTPSGVAAVSRGDRLCASVDGVGVLEFRIA
ncbi:MAG: fumarylacetoacetate hydrolase family protein [Gammaproteobacteria bacterium]|nr:fumarylacetoacetate hydrolase family protein [Gammaproteobacteria bacterium]